MIRRLGEPLGILFILILFNLLSLLFAHRAVQDPGEKWEDILISMKSFLADPAANFSRVEKIEDLNYWTQIYYLVKGRNYVEELFSNQFKVSDIDENKLNIIFNLLLKYSIDPNPYDGPIALIIDRLVEIMQNRPEWFFESLLKRPQWKEIMRFIAAKRKENINEYIIAIENEARKKEILHCLDELEREKDDEYRWLELFLKEHDKYAEDAKNIHNWGSIIGRYEQSHLDEKQTLREQYNPIQVMSKWILDNPDELKLKVLFILLQNLTTGYHAEIISDIGAKVFIDHPQLFISCLKDYGNWRYLLFRISYDVYSHIYWEKKSLEDMFSNIGNSDFEKEVIKELEFIISLVKEQIKKIEQRTLLFS
ncbi:MAG: hypothetical protein H5U06_10095 [Candidatus Aminicenantes bacterium]|nr:hypothetical protein [Candidatus Aminicenantes bacterium]